jgi:hypothetical protein
MRRIASNRQCAGPRFGGAAFRHDRLANFSPPVTTKAACQFDGIADGMRSIGKSTLRPLEDERHAICFLRAVLRNCRGNTDGD